MKTIILILFLCPALSISVGGLFAQADAQAKHPLPLTHSLGKADQPTGFEDLKNLSGEKYLLDWSLIKFNKADFERLKGKSINEKIQIIREDPPKGYGIPVLIFDITPKNTPANSSLVKTNLESFKDWIKFYENPKQPEYCWANIPDANAQYMPPYLFNSPEAAREKFRPGMDKGQIHLSLAASDLSVPHELSHHFFQNQVFPKQVKMEDGRILHVYNASTVLANLKEKELLLALEKFNSLNTKKGVDQDELYRSAMDLYLKFLEFQNLDFIGWVVPALEEMVLFWNNFQMADDLGLSRELKREALWKHITELMKVSELIEKFQSQQIYEALVANHGANRLDDRLVAEFSKLKKRLDAFKKQLATTYSATAAACLTSGNLEFLDPMVNQGRIKVAMEGDRINIQVP